LKHLNEFPGKAGLRNPVSRYTYPMSTFAIETDKLTKRVGDVTAVAAVSLHVGEFDGFLGLKRKIEQPISPICSYNFKKKDQADYGKNINCG
jgi:hypothetical protein